LIIALFFKRFLGQVFINSSPQEQSRFGLGAALKYLESSVSARPFNAALFGSNVMKHPFYDSLTQHG
jgi:hypothetical protein